MFSIHGVSYLRILATEDRKTPHANGPLDPINSKIPYAPAGLRV